MLAADREAALNNIASPASELNHHPSKARVIGLALGALGVVYGDIGTSPLYTLKECFHGDHGLALTHTNIFGAMSLIFWSLNIVVTVKYILFVLRADNHGEGGIFALLGLVSSDGRKLSPRLRSFTIAAGILGAGLLTGEGVITPAISVLSAVEGLQVATRAADRFVVPLTCVILFSLFLLQHRGTGGIGKLFGPVMAVWFAAIAGAGLMEVLSHPEILAAVHPAYAVEFFATNRFQSIFVFGSVVLCLTGCEALYADLGHFGKKPIRISWAGVVLPALICNYFGQAALLLGHPEKAFHPFYGLIPETLLYPMVVLATMATVIASQALISGVFSLTQQGIDLGFCPRLRIVHTSHEIKGQIYIPVVNYALMVACLGVVIGFGESSGLAGAYGIAVTGTMNITSTLFFILITRKWGWPLWKALPLFLLFIAFDASYFLANLLKIMNGGWFTLLAALLLTLAMTTWRKGRAELIQKVGTRLPLKMFLEDLAKHKIPRVPGTAVFMSIHPDGTSPVLLHHLSHTKILYDRVVMLSILPANIPKVPDGERVAVNDLGQGFFQILAHNGYMQRPNVPEIMKLAEKFGLRTKPMETTFYLGRVTILTDGTSRMMSWRKNLFAFMSRIAGSPAAYFNLPPNRVVELGAQIQL
ncbi:MAG TPA: potassium transporter Kup [Thermodesulfobacteriota bacterium]|nr:potassium transporter Kup [Thermodesulfobacteriota bacterium]